MSGPTPMLPLAAATAQRLSGHPLILFLDVDGTLSPIAPHPGHAVVPDETRRILSELTAVPEAYVVVVTGRGADDGRRLVGVDAAWVIGNHGIEVSPPHRTASARDDVAHFEQKIDEASKRLQRFVDEPGREGAYVENKRWTLSLHYRQADKRAVPELTDEITRIAGELGLRLTTGKEVLELRPPVEVDKGTAAVELAETLGAMHPGAAVLAAGDDKTDEDMFRALRARQPRAVTVRVGSGVETDAEFCVKDTDAMRELLAGVLALYR